MSLQAEREVIQERLDQEKTLARYRDHWLANTDGLPHHGIWDPTVTTVICRYCLADVWDEAAPRACSASKATRKLIKAAAGEPPFPPDMANV